MIGDKDIYKEEIDLDLLRVDRETFLPYTNFCLWVFIAEEAFFFLFRFFSHTDHYRILSIVLCPIELVLISYYFIYSGMYMSVTVSQFIPLPYLLVTIRLSSTSVTLQKKLL